MKPTEYEYDEAFEHIFCGGDTKQADELLRLLQMKGYHLYKQGDVPEWFEPSSLNAYTSGYPLYRNTKEARND